MGFRGREFELDSPAAAVDALIARVKAGAALLGIETVDLTALNSGGTIGRILADDVEADRDSPAFDHSAMDGYAVRAESLASAASGLATSLVVPVTDESRIGYEPPSLTGGLEAIRIATGAAMPFGTDAVVRREDTGEQGHAGDEFARTGRGVRAIEVAPQVARRITSGQHVRRRGENARAGSVVLRAGEVITAAGLGTLAAVGATRPRVFQQLRVTVITTGEEIVTPSASPSAYQIRNSNAPSIHAILASQRWMEAVSGAHAGDGDELSELLRNACTCSDAVVLTGGVSMGHRDPVREVIESLGAEIVFHGLPQRPGKPMLGAVLNRSNLAKPVPLFGLPGNPVSALVTCTRIVMPVLAACAGARRTPRACLPLLVNLANPDGRRLDLWWHRLARLGLDDAGRPAAELIDGRGSGDIVAAGLSDGFVEQPPSATPDLVAFYPWPAA